MYRDPQVHNNPACKSEDKVILIVYAHLKDPYQTAERLGVDILSIDGFECERYSIFSFMLMNV